MNSHDKGLLYASLSPEQRERFTTRQLHLADIRDAMEKGFKPEPDVALHHLPLLSDEALSRFFAESEEWRGKAHERALEEIIQTKQAEYNQLNDHYIGLRKILGALDVPGSFRSVLGQPRHVAWTEQKARELVKAADNSSRNYRAATEAEARVDLLEAYVRKSDEKRLPYNWNVFKLPLQALRDTVCAIDATERLTNCDTDVDRVNYFAERKAQETEQSLRWHAQRHEALRKLIHRMNNHGEIRVAAASELMDTLLDRPQTGEQTKDWQPAEDWIVWEWQYKPNDLPDDQVVEIRTYGGGENILEAGVVEWSDVEKYRRVK